VLAVCHKQYVEGFSAFDLAARLRGGRVLVDVKGVIDRDAALAQGITIWRP
jgi:hypothetical protein